MSAVTERLAYIEKPSAVDSKSYTHSCLPVNGATFSPGSIIRIDIPCSGHGQYLDSQNSYLKFTINNLSQNSGSNEIISIDGHASSFINRLMVLYSGYTLEDINSYNEIHSILFDNNISYDERRTLHSITAGTNASDTVRTGAAIAAGGSLTVFVPLISQVLGLNADKYIPLGKMTASDSLRLELTLENAGIPVLCANAGGSGQFSVTDVEYVAQIVKLSDEAESMVSRSTGGVYRVHGDTFRSFNVTVNSGVNSASINVPVKVSTLKTVFVSHRAQASTTNNQGHYITGRDRADMTEFYLQVGSVRLPQKPILWTI